MKTENQEKVWDKIASEWDEYRQKPKEEIKDFLKGKSGKILDLGCGSGRNFLEKKNQKFYGVDFSKEMLKFAAKKKIAAHELKKASAEKIPYPNDFFDFALYISALHCIPSKEHRKKSLEELKRVLKKKSMALISVWSGRHSRLINHPKNASISWKKQSEKIWRYYYIYEKGELEKLLKDVGFNIIKSWEDKNINIIVEKPKS